MTAPTAPDDWQPLPARARSLFVLAALPMSVVPAAVAGFVLATISEVLAAWAGGVAGLLVGAAFGAWLGLKQFRHLRWRVDDTGLAVRRGRMWQHETRVPATRVQHLDLKRGPLQRGRGLATLIVHTAGTRLSAVTVPHLDAADAERLRDQLGRQIDHDDDA